MDSMGNWRCDKYGIISKPSIIEPEEVFDINKTLNERDKTYGDFSLHAKITQDLKCVMQQCPKWSNLNCSQREALEMIQHKIGRILNGDPNHADSWIDIAGYATLVANRLEKK